MNAPRPDSDSYGSNDEDETLIVENDRARFQRDIVPNGSTMMSYRGEQDTSISISRRLVHIHSVCSLLLKMTF